MESHTKLRVAILMGGSSNEREISLESGRNVFYKIPTQSYEPIPIFVSKTNDLYKINQQLLVKNSTAEVETALSSEMKLLWHNLPTIADFVFIALHGGIGENGAVQGALEMLELPYNGSGIFASALCMDKFKTNELLKTAGFDIPDHLLISASAWQEHKINIIENIEQRFTYPCIVKPHNDGCSVMVQKAKNRAELEHAIDTIFTNHKTHILLQEFVQGMELTVGVLGNEHPRALPPSQAISTGDILSIEEKFLPGAGENQTPAPLPEATLTAIQHTVASAYKTAGCQGYARIDCFYQTAAESKTGKERVLFLEFNTLPALTPATCLFHQAAEVGIRPAEFIHTIITLGLDRWKHERSATMLVTADMHAQEAQHS